MLVSRSDTFTSQLDPLSMGKTLHVFLSTSEIHVVYLDSASTQRSASCSPSRPMSVLVCPLLPISLLNRSNIPHHSPHPASLRSVVRSDPNALPIHPRRSDYVRYRIRNQHLERTDRRQVLWNLLLCLWVIRCVPRSRRLVHPFLTFQVTSSNRVLQAGQ